MHSCKLNVRWYSGLDQRKTAQGYMYPVHNQITGTSISDTVI